MEDIGLLSEVTKILSSTEVTDVSFDVFSITSCISLSSALLLSIPTMTPDESITGRKKIARTNPLPLKFWFNSNAIKKLNAETHL